MSYKKVILNEFGGPQVLQVVEEAALPEPEAGDVRIKVLVASATFTDTMVRKGIYYGFKETPPLSPGYDMVGAVDKLGAGVTGIEIGQMVADLSTARAARSGRHSSNWGHCSIWRCTALLLKLSMSWSKAWAGLRLTTKAKIFSSKWKPSAVWTRLSTQLAVIISSVRSSP
jgi:hypothetical protein